MYLNFINLTIYLKILIKVSPPINFKAIKKNVYSKEFTIINK